MAEKSQHLSASNAWAGRDDAYDSGERTGAELGDQSERMPRRVSATHRHSAGENAAALHGATSPVMPKGYRRSDERILEDVCEHLSRSGVDIKNVSVEVKDGCVTLGGEVADRRMKHAVEDVAAECRGVEDVDNRLRVRPGVTGRSISSYGSDA